jgi:excisionase family DNA binding protein
MTKEKSPFVTIENLAQYFHVSVSTIRSWVRQGHIPETTYIGLGNTYRFNRDAVASALTGMERDGEEEGHGVEIVSATGGVGSVIATPNNSEEDQLEFNFDADEDV